MNLIEQMMKRPLWDAAGEGGAGGDAGAGGTGDPAPGGAAPGAGDAGGGAGSGSGDAASGDAAKKSTILDFAPKGDPKPGDQKDGNPGEAWKLPDGIEIPEHLRGQSAEETLRKLSTAYKGARQELSSKRKADGVLEGAVPKDLNGYEFTTDNPDDPIYKDLVSEESKPIVDSWRKAALEVGIPDAAFSKFMQMGIKNMADNGLTLTGNPEEAAKIRGEAEMSALVSEFGQAGADQMLRQIDTYAQKLAKNGILTSQADVEEFAQMVGTKEGLKIFHRIMVAEFGEKAIPAADPVAGAPTLEEAYAAHSAAMAMPQGSDREAAVARAEAALAKAMKESSTPGAVRSRVM